MAIMDTHHHLPSLPTLLGILRTLLIRMRFILRLIPEHSNTSPYYAVPVAGSLQPALDTSGREHIQ